MTKELTPLEAVCWNYLGTIDPKEVEALIVQMRRELADRKPD